MESPERWRAYEGEYRIHKLVDALEAIAMMRSKDECPLAAEMRKIAIKALRVQEEPG